MCAHATHYLAKWKIDALTVHTVVSNDALTTSLAWCQNNK